MDYLPSVTLVLVLSVLMLSVLMLSAFMTAWLSVNQRPIMPPRVSRSRLALFGGWLVLTGLLWTSDYPVAWRLPELIDYLAEPTLAAFRILCVTATGTVTFGSAVALLSWAGRKRR